MFCIIFCNDMIVKVIFIYLLIVKSPSTIENTLKEGIFNTIFSNVDFLIIFQFYKLKSQSLFYDSFWYFKTYSCKIPYCTLILDCKHHHVPFSCHL